MKLIYNNPFTQNMLWSDCYGRWHFYYYVCAWDESKRITQVGQCVCERSEWEILLRSKRSDLPKDFKLIKNAWRRFTSFDLETFTRAYSNHFTFLKVRVLSPIPKPFDFKKKILSVKDNPQLNYNLM